MGRQNSDTSIVGSSIVLLQERFKQLQRLKEMREERLTSKLMPQDEAVYYHHDQLSGTSFSTAYQDPPPLALGLHSTSHHTPQLRGINPPAVRRPHTFFENHDVDTSLRL